MNHYKIDHYSCWGWDKPEPPGDNEYVIHYVSHEREVYIVMKINGYSRFWISPDDGCWRAFCGSDCFDRDPQLKLKDSDFAWYLGVSESIGHSIKSSCLQMLESLSDLPPACNEANHWITLKETRPLPKEVFDSESNAAWESEKIRRGILK